MHLCVLIQVNNKKVFIEGFSIYSVYLLVQGEGKWKLEMEDTNRN